MAGVTCAGNGHAISDLQIENFRTDGFNNPGGAVTKRKRLVHFGHDVLKCSDDAMGAHLGNDLPHEIWSLPGFSDQGFLRELHNHFFGAGTDDRGGGAHNHTTGQKNGRRHFYQFQVSTPDTLNDL
jgi:hypothetical protein